MMALTTMHQDWAATLVSSFVGSLHSVAENVAHIMAVLAKIIWQKTVLRVRKK